MQTRISSKGQIVLPGPIRRKLGLQAGDTLEATIRNGGILLAPERPRTGKRSIVRDPLTGLPVLTAGTGAPVLTSEQVREILADFP